MTSKRACGKRRYRDHAEAVAALHDLEVHSTRSRIPKRAYECMFCSGWHLTSSSVDPRPPGGAS